jgi:hypothetical protein
MKKINESTSKVSDIIGTKEKLEEKQRRFYCDKITENLKYIKSAHEQIRGICDIIWNADRYPISEDDMDIVRKGLDIKIWRIPQTDDALTQLRYTLQDPEIWYEIRNYLPVLDGPYIEFQRLHERPDKRIAFGIVGIADIQLGEINKYLKLISAECAR